MASDDVFATRVLPEHVLGDWTIVEVLNRGEYAGNLHVRSEDVWELVKRLSGNTSVNQSMGTIESGVNVTGVKIDRLG